MKNQRLVKAEAFSELEVRIMFENIIGKIQMGSFSRGDKVRM
jgi:hypothetical protein